MSEREPGNGIVWPDPMSEPCARYVEASDEILRHVVFSHGILRGFDHLYAFVEAGLPSPSEGLAMIAEWRRRTDIEKARQGGIVFEMVLTRTVDNYLSYVADLLASVFRSRPEMLRSSEQVSTDFILRHNSMEELIEALAERRVERLSYQGLGALVENIEETHGFRLFSSEAALQAAVKAVEVRHVIVHNRAIANRRFLERVPDAGFDLGERVYFMPNELIETIETFGQTVIGSERRAVEKWDLPCPFARDDVGARRWDRENDGTWPPPAVLR